jgi:hypothetical protein
VTGIQPAGHLGEEESEIRNALIDDASHTFVQVQRYLKGLGLIHTIPLYEDSSAPGSIELATERTSPERVISALTL